MDAQDTTQLLAQLREIHLPVAPVEPSLAPLIVAAILIAAAVAALMLKVFHRESSWVAIATSELDEIEKNQDSNSLLQTAELLKRIVLHVDRSPAINQLTGRAWLTYLDNFFATRFFTSGHGQIFGNSLYRRDSTTESDKTQLYKTLRKLIRQRKWRDD